MPTLIKNTQARIIGIGRPGSTAPILLKPGNNSVPDKDMEIIIDNPHSDEMFELKILELVDVKVIAPPPPPEGTEDQDEPEADPAMYFDLGTVNVSDAAGIIAETYDISLLKAWAERDERSTVQKAIIQQLERIDHAGEKNGNEE